MLHKPTIETYNKIAKEYQSRNLITIYLEEYEVFRSLLGNKTKILEIGCGAGRDAEAFISFGFDYTGMDASEGMLQEAKDRVKDGTFLIGDFYKLNFLDESFDGFWAAASFLHVPKTEIGKVLSEARRILKPEGIGFISLKQKTSIDEGVIEEEKMGGIARYFSFYEEDEFRTILKSNGFKVISIMKEKESDNNKTTWLCFFIQKV